MALEVIVGLVLVQLVEEAAERPEVLVLTEVAAAAAMILRARARARRAAA